MSDQVCRAISEKATSGIEKREKTDRAGNNQRAIRERTENIRKAFRPLNQHISLICPDQPEAKNKKARTSK